MNEKVDARLFEEIMVLLFSDDDDCESIENETKSRYKRKVDDGPDEFNPLKQVDEVIH